jgi:Ca2+-transporting ATPase
MSMGGLTITKAEFRLGQDGRNEVPTRAQLMLAAAIPEQLRDPLILVLRAACVLTLLTGDLTDAVVIAVVVAANTAITVCRSAARTGPSLRWRV